MNVVIRAVSMSFSREMCSSLESEHGVAIIVTTLRFVFSYFEVFIFRREMVMVCASCSIPLSRKLAAFKIVLLKLLLKLNEVVK